MKEAAYYSPLTNNQVKCLLCPHSCQINSGETGICGTRKNLDGKLMALTYGKISALHIDPIEKKPLYHFLPGSYTLSIGSVGCNLRCSFCQNCDISQIRADQFQSFTHNTPLQIIEKAKTENLKSIAFTYNEPGINFEFVKEIATKAKEAGICTVMISNGYLNMEPLKELIPYVDAFNIDLKAMSNEFYLTQTSSNLHPVLESLKTIYESDKHLEITNLVITALNDTTSSFTNLITWISTELDENVPLHISRYFPRYKMQRAPTSIRRLEQLYMLAKEYLNYVYLGNTNQVDKSSTFCKNCQELLIERQAYHTTIVGMDSNGNCSNCHTENLLCAENQA